VASPGGFEPPYSP